MKAPAPSLLAVMAVMFVSPVVAGCASNGNVQESVASPQPAVTEDISADGDTRGATKFEIMSALEPLIRSIVTFTDTEYVSGGADVDFKSVYSAITANWNDVQQKRDAWDAFLSSNDVTQTDEAMLPTKIAAYNQGLDAWMAHQRAGLELWGDCLKADPSQIAMVLCTTAELDMKKEQQVLDSYTAPLKSLMTSLGVIR